MGSQRVRNDGTHMQAYFAKKRKLVYFKNVFMSTFNVLKIKIKRIKIFMFQLRSVPYLHYASSMLRREKKKKQHCINL